MSDFSRYPLLASTGVDPDTGLLRKEDGSATHYEPVFLAAGTEIVWNDAAGDISLFAYSAEPDWHVFYTYSYPEEGTWTFFRKNENIEKMPRVWRCEKDMHARFVFRNGTQPHTLADAGTFRIRDRSMPPWIREEAERVRDRLRKMYEEDPFVCVLLGDSHCGAGSNWPYTAESIRSTMQGFRADRLIHLGDLTDGSMPLDVTRRIASGMLSDMKELGIPFGMCVGNHDLNAFRGNSPSFTPAEAAECYLGREEGWYLEDLPQKNLRIFYLDSFDPGRRQRYGFCASQLRWFKKKLRETPDGRDVLIFSHVPPAPEIHVWSDRILNGKRMLRLADRMNRKKRIRIRGWFHGHSHADQIWEKYSFPVVCTGCSKTESFYTHKPLASDTPFRSWNERTQELWDVVVMDADEIRMIRYGAGWDRTIRKEEWDRK